MIDQCPKMLAKLSEKKRQQEEAKDELVSPFTVGEWGCMLGVFNPSRNPSENHSSFFLAVCTSVKQCPVWHCSQLLEPLF